MMSKRVRREALSFILLTSLLCVPGVLAIGLNAEHTGSMSMQLHEGIDWIQVQDNPTKALSDSLTCTYSSYLGGSDSEISDRARFSIAVDEDGNAFITGSTASTNFPTMNAYQGTHGGLDDAFVSKIADNGTLLFSTFLGGSGNDYGTNIAVDSEGNVIVLGCTTSSNYPTTSGVYQTSNGGAQDVFVAKFSNSGLLLSSTFLGGSDSEWSYGMTVDSAGNVIIGGETFSDDMPLQNAYQVTYEGLGDTFVAKIDEDLQTLAFSTYLGGDQNEWWVDVAVDQDDNIILNGASLSNDFPITEDVVQHRFRGVADAIVTKLSPDGQTLIFSTYLGGNYFDMGTGVDVDSEGNIAITGETSSFFPVMQAYQQVRGHLAGEKECFVAMLRANGSMVFSTYLAGSGESMGYDTAFDEYGNIIVVGEATSTSFPIVNPYQGSHGGDGEDWDAFVAALNSTGSVVFSTYLGGDNDDSARGVAIDAFGDILVTGWTLSTDFPTVSAFQENNNGTEDIFFSKFDPGDLRTYTPDPGDNIPSSPTTTPTTPSTPTTGDSGPPLQLPLELLVVPIVLAIVVLVIFKRRR